MSRSPRGALPLFLLLSLLFTDRARGQGCCAPGASPLGGLSGTLPAAGDFDAGLWIESFSLDQAYEGARKIDDVNDRRGRVTRGAAFVRAGLPAGLALLVEVPYESRRRDQTFLTKSGELELNFENNAPGDVSTFLLVQILPRRGVSPWGLEAGAGVKWANGSVDRTDGGRFLPVELQSGTGSTDPLFSLSARRTWSRFSIQTASAFRIGMTGRNDYRFGSEWNAVANFNWAVTPAWTVGGDVRVRLAGQDGIAGRTPPNTGGERVMAGPRLTGSLRALKLKVYGAWLVPVHQNLNGRQLGVSRQLLAGLAWPSL